MANLRGGQQLWNGNVSASGVSPLAIVGAGPYVAVYIQNTGSIAATITVQASATAKPDAGRNALDGTTDGGLVWFDYFDKTADAAAIQVTVAAGQSRMLDLSPYAPQFIRLKRTDALADTTLVAIVSAFGAN